jgi:hypothetical protein
MGDLLTWLMNAVKTGITISLDFVNKTVSSAGAAVQGAENDPLGWLGGAANMVVSSGAAGPAAQAASYILNFPNYVGSKSDLTKVVTDALRQQQYRYQA